jgi:hypothetical protein
VTFLDLIIAVNEVLHAATIGMAELAARFLGIVDELEDVEMSAATQADAGTRRAKTRSE